MQVRPQTEAIDFSRVYNRSSMSFMITSHPGDEFEERVKTYFEKNNLSDKYNVNPVSSDSYMAPFTRENQIAIDEKAATIEKYLNEQNYAKQIVGFWYNRKPDGSMDMDNCFKRGRYNATDDDYSKAMNTKLGEAVLLDAGLKLVKESYIVVFDVHHITKTIFESVGVLVWNGTVDVHLYQLDYNEDINKQVYDSWFYSNENFTEVEKQEKNALFNQIDFKFKHVLSTSKYIETDKNISMMIAMAEFSNAMSNSQKKVAYTGNGESEFQDFINRMYTQGMEAVELKRPDLKVKTPIYDTRPIVAKIGKKEGLRRNHQYGVFEVVVNEKTGEPISKRVATIRAARVGKNQVNTVGDMHEKGMMTRFGVIARSSKIEPGMFIEQEKNHSMAVYADFSKQGSDYSMFALGLRNQNFTTARGFTGALKLDMFVIQNYITYGNDVYYIEDEIYKNWAVGMRFGYSLGFNILHPNFKVEPFGMMGLGSSTKGSFDYNYYTGEHSFSSGPEFTLSYGSYFVFNVHYPFQVYLKYENQYVMNAEQTYSAVGFGVRY
jgi:hypothetical protein